MSTALIVLMLLLAWLAVAIVIALVLGALIRRSIEAQELGRARSSSPIRAPEDGQSFPDGTGRSPSQTYER